MPPPSPLRADLHAAPAIPTTARLPDGSTGLWQPTVVTLISGATSAVLVDTLFTTAQAASLGDWIEHTLGATRKLTTIYITHGHGDHWFNVAQLLRRFPAVDVVATRATVDHMRTQLEPGMRAFWEGMFPAQIDGGAFRVPARPLEEGDDGRYTFELEGHVLEAVEVGHSDTEASSFLHVPALRMVVAGDVVYNDVHMWMAESASRRLRDAWVAALDRVEAEAPAVVVGSHHRPGGVDGAFNIAASREYVRTFGRLVGESGSAVELYGKVLEAYPNRLGRLVLWLGCKAAFPSE